MKIKVVLFDLDGTLLPMDQEEFTKCYFLNLTKAVSSAGYEAKGLIDAVWAGTKAMVQNDGTKTNAEAFWSKQAEIYGDKIIKDKPIFDEFYETGFDRIKPSCGFNSDANRAVKRVKQLGLKAVLATNPIFPATATQSRIRWAGLDISDFELYTAYENSSYCKPNLDYYRNILKEIDCKADECIMVGNDVSEDMVASKLGMKVFLLSDCLINKNSEDISIYPSGSFNELIEFIEKQI